MHSLAIQDRNISRIFLVDDNPQIRSLYDDMIDDLELDTHDVTDVVSVQNLISLTNENDGFICDFHLINSRYSPVNGDVIVSQLYQRGVPAVLCSRDAEMAHSVRRYRHSIPCILEARDLNGDSVKESFSTCIKEFSGEFSKKRKPWDTLIRVESIISESQDSARIALVIPGWDASTLIETDIAPEDFNFFDLLLKTLNGGQDFRCRAQVNLDAESVSDIYIKNWVGF